MSVAAYFDPQVLSSAHPQALGELANVFIIAFGALLVIAIAARIVVQFLHIKNPYMRRLLRRFVVWGVSFSIVGLIHTLAQQAEVDFIGARLVIVIAFVIYLVWLVVLLYQLIAVYPTQREMYERNERRALYLPKKKGR